MLIVFVSGHLNTTQAEFDEHYAPRLLKHLGNASKFIVADARGTDTLAQRFLANRGADVTVFHMFERPRNNQFELPTKGGYRSDEERDAAMTSESDVDVAWVRPGRENSGTARNLLRREHQKRGLFPQTDGSPTTWKQPAGEPDQGGN
jgi:hypothetical protein